MSPAPSMPSMFQPASPDFGMDLPMFFCDSKRRISLQHKRQISQDTQDLLDRLDYHEQHLEQIIEFPPSSLMMPRQSTHSDDFLLERLDERIQEMERLLHLGADLLACDNVRLGCCATCADLSSQGRLDLERNCLLNVAADDEFGEASSTTASSCGDLCNELSSPRSLGLGSEDDDVQSKVVLGLAAEELKCLHREIYAVRKQLSVSQIERLSKAVDILAGAIC